MSVQARLSGFKRESNISIQALLYSIFWLPIFDVYRWFFFNVFLSSILTTGLHIPGSCRETTKYFLYANISWGYFTVLFFSYFNDFSVHWSIDMCFSTVLHFRIIGIITAYNFKIPACYLVYNRLQRFCSVRLHMNVSCKLVFCRFIECFCNGLRYLVLTLVSPA